ncbi:MAG TPA: hypothetical protein VN181_12495 [Thermoanaerobaculia bacterium]|nr:hypothetical protein [Thermoanaerobaculia bacterium]
MTREVLLASLLNVIFGVLFITLVIYFANFQDQLVLFYYAGHGSQQVRYHDPEPLTRSVGRSAERLDFSWVTDLSDAGLAFTKRELTNRLIESEEGPERAQLVITIRELRRYRQLASNTSPPRSDKNTIEKHTKDAAPSSGAINVSLGTDANDDQRQVSNGSRHRAAITSANDYQGRRAFQVFMEPVEKQTQGDEDAFDTFWSDLVERPRIFIKPIALGTAYFLIIAFGIYTGSIYEVLGSMKSDRRMKLRQVVRQAGTVGMWQGIIASPIIFGVVLLLVTTYAFSFPMAFLAYQNGFFWRATLKKFAEVREKGQEPKHAAT